MVESGDRSWVWRSCALLVGICIGSFGLETKCVLRCLGGGDWAVASVGMMVALSRGVTCCGSDEPLGADLDGWALVFGRLGCLGERSACFLVRRLGPGDPALGAPFCLEEVWVFFVDACGLPGT